MKRKANVSYYKAGNGTGARITLSVPLLKEIGITEECKEVEIEYKKDKIVITKK